MNLAVTTKKNGKRKLTTMVTGREVCGKEDLLPIGNVIVVGVNPFQQQLLGRDSITPGKRLSCEASSSEPSSKIRQK